MKALVGSVSFALAVGLGFINALALNGPGNSVALLLAAAVCIVPATVLLPRKGLRWFAVGLLLFFLLGAWADRQDGLAAQAKGPAPREGTR